jgi:hypothetical protein
MRVRNLHAAVVLLLGMIGCASTGGASFQDDYHAVARARAKEMHEAAVHESKASQTDSANEPRSPQQSSGLVSTPSSAPSSARGAQTVAPLARSAYLDEPVLADGEFVITPQSAAAYDAERRRAHVIKHADRPVPQPTAQLPAAVGLNADREVARELGNAAVAERKLAATAREAAAAERGEAQAARLRALEATDPSIAAEQRATAAEHIEAAQRYAAEAAEHAATAARQRAALAEQKARLERNLTSAE